MKDAPTEERETANAAYLLRKSVQLDLRNAFCETGLSLDDAEWHIDRYRRAKSREAETELLARASEKRK